MLRKLRAALMALGFAAATLGAAARAAPPPSPEAEPASRRAPAAPAELSPGAKALLVGEDPSLGAAAPDLGEVAGREILGRPIARVEVITVGGRWATPLTLHDAAVQPGQPATPEATRRAMREALGTGRFARANVEAYLEGGGVVLRLNVLPRRLIAAVQLTGSALDTAETLEAAEASVDAELTFPQFARIEERVRRFYKLHGFPSAEVHADAADTDKPDKVILSVTIKPGAPRTVASRAFVVDAVVDRLTGEVTSNPAADREVGSLRSAYKVGRGARVDEPALAEADRDLTEVLRQHGFFRAEVKHRLLDRGDYTYLYVYLTPGPRLLPTFDGNRAFDKTDLEDALDLAKAPGARPGELTERLRTFYVARGFLDAEVSLSERGRPEDPVHFLSFTIHEHQQVRVTRRVFPCLEGELSPDDVGREIDSFLEEDLPGTEAFGPVDPRAINRLFGPTARTGQRAPPVYVFPKVTYAPATYDRAVKHLRDLLHSKGYFNAVVGPVAVVRATCSRLSPAGQCLPVVPKAKLEARCEKDALGVPAPEPAVPDAFTCRPDPARGVTCASDVTVRLPIALGPQTALYDLAFEGNRTQTSAALARIADLPLGTPLSSVELEAARLRVLDHYRTLGFAYAEVRADTEPSPDRSRARVRFVVSEREPVTVTGFVVQGNSRTSESLILGRVALKKNREYRQDWARQTEERVATLGTFSSVSVALEDANVPQKEKRVVISVVEQATQYLEQRPGFSTGDGFRYTFEYGHRNLGGQAISIVFRVQLSYLPDALILDPGVLANYSKLSVLQRLERRDTLSVTFREVGLGPLVSLTLDAIDLNDNQRDYGIDKEAFVPTLTYRPIRALTTQFGVSTELNDVSIFNDTTAASTFGLVRAPAGRTIALAERLGFTADYRDNPFNATKGTIFSTSLEHVNAFPLDESATIQSHFLRLTGRFAAYLSRWGMTLALSLGAGGNIQLSKGSQTYPDRLFFLGGVDSVRAFLADALVPQDIADKIKTVGTPVSRDPGSGLPTGQRGSEPQSGLPTAQRSLTIEDVNLRGGDLAINPRVEIRIPLVDWLQTGVFLDMGNAWLDPKQFRIDGDVLRYGLGAGLRVPTPIGPIALDYGFNLNRRPWEDVGAFHFAIGLF